MSARDEFADRFREALLVPILSLIFVVLGRVIETINQTNASVDAYSIDLFIGLTQSMPGLLTLLGITIAVAIGGPLGLIGALLETVGASQLLFHQNITGVWMMALGAALVIIGGEIPWLKLLTNSNRDNYR